MKITSSNFNLFSSPVSNIRGKIFELEEKLNEMFSVPFTLIPVPDGLPSDIPRITAASEHGYSNLSISLNSFQLTTNFSPDYAEDWQKCSTYLKERINRLTNTLMPEYFKESYYCGLLLYLQYETTEEEAISLFNRLFIKKELKKLYDFMGKYTFTHNKLYINIQIQNQRVVPNLPFATDFNFNPGALKAEENNHLIGIVLDVNDRYGYNYTPDYRSSNTKMDDIFQVVDNMVNQKLPHFLKTGEIEI